MSISNTSITYEETPGGRINVVYFKAADKEKEKLTITNTEINGEIRDLVEIKGPTHWAGDVIIYCYMVPDEESEINIKNLYNFTNGSETLEEEIPEALDITSLEAAIQEAIAAKEGIAVSDDGTDMSAGTYWVTQADIDALDAAIAAAEAAKETVETRQDVAEAVEALESAVSTFNESKQEAIDGEEEMEGTEDADEGVEESEEQAGPEEPDNEQDAEDDKEQEDEQVDIEEDIG